MLCEKCKMRDATVRITKITDGNVEEHHFCPECAEDFRQRSEIKSSEWSKAIFKMISNAMMQRSGSKENDEENERLKKISCPTCGKTYGDFLNDNTFGCGDCYDAFGPALTQTILSIQGADTHVGRRASGKKQSTRKPVKEELSPEEEIEMLKEKMQEAVGREDYEAAASFRDQIREKEGARK